MTKFLPLTIAVFFLFSFLDSDGQVATTPGVVATNPAVTINQAAAQVDPTNNAPINFTVVFDQPVAGFTAAGVTLSGTATGNLVKVATGGPMTWNVAVAGMTSCGTVIANVPAGVCANALSEPNLASTSTDNTVTYLATLPNPSVTINQAAAQADPTLAAPVNFTVVFDQPVTGFATGDVTLSGTAGATTGIVTGSGTTYNVAVSGITATGTVIATIAAGVCQSACAQPNNASTSTDNTVTINCIPPTVTVTPTVACGGVAGIYGVPLTASGSSGVTYVWSPLPGLYTNQTSTAPYTGTDLVTVYAAPTVSTTYTVTATNTATGCTNTATALVNYTPPAPVLTPPSVYMCLGDAAVKVKVVGGLPATPAIWSPITGLFRDPAAAVPYIGNAVDSVWVRPTPAGVYTYQVTTGGTPPGSPFCASPPRSLVVTVGQPPVITTQPVNQTLCGGTVAGFHVVITGSGPITYQWQVSTNGGSTYTNVNNGNPYSGGTTATLTINPATTGMNGYLYRVVVAGCTTVTSSTALLTVGVLPTIVINANPLTITSTQTSTISSTVTPNPAVTYTWYYNNGVLPGATLPTLLVTYGSPGNYYLKVIDVNGCTNTSNTVTIANSFAAGPITNLLTYPNPSGGVFEVKYFSEPNTTVQRSLIIYNNRGDRVMNKDFTQTIPYQKVIVDARPFGKGLYWVELRDNYGRRLAMSKVSVQ